MWLFGRLWSVCEVVLVPYVDEAVDVTVMRVLLFVLRLCMLRECKSAMVTEMLVWGMEELLWWEQGMWVVDVVQVLCLTQLTCYGWVWCVGCEELVEYVRCVCVCLGAVSEERGWVDERIGFGLYLSCGNRGSCVSVDVCLCLDCGGVGGIGGEWVGGLGQGLEGWSGFMSVWVVSPDYLCIWQVQLSVYMAGPVICILCLMDACAY